MSCGRLHGHGNGLNLHEHLSDLGPEDEEPHAHETADGPDEHEQDPDGGRHAADPEPPSRMRLALAGAWEQHGYLVKPPAAVLTVDGAGWFIHQVLGHSPETAVITAAVCGAVLEVVTEVRNQMRGRSGLWRVMTRLEATGATAWMLLAGAVTPFGWQDIVQWLALAGGLALGGNHLYQDRKRHRAPKMPPWARELPAEPPAVEAAPPPPDPRLVAFTDRFCQPGGELDGAVPGELQEQPYGFSFILDLPVHTRRHLGEVQGLVVPIAKLYNVTRNDVTIDYDPNNRTENRCLLIIRQVPVIVASERRPPSWNRWDGESSWDPVTGLMDLGRFADGETTHYRLNTPHSGTAMGVAAGVAGSGKSGTLHVITADAGRAMLCSHCSMRPRDCRCGQCDPQRAWAVWCADPQEQGMSVWKGRADLTGWGPEGAVELLEFAEQTADARGKARAEMQWWDKGPDGLQRVNTGKGWFDVEVGWPGILLVVDEWPLLVSHPDPELRNYAQHVILKAITEWRKRGIHPLLASASLDLQLIGLREIRDLMTSLNVIGHRADQVSSSMGGITGDPRKLSPDEPGAGYINGYDQRPGVQFTTKYAPENLWRGGTGVDIRHLAGLIADTPLLYDPGTQAVMESWGITHQMVFTKWKGRPSDSAATLITPNAAPAAGAAAPAAQGPATGPGISGLAYREDAEKVLTVLRERDAALHIFHLMEETGLSLGAVGAVLDALASNGQVIQISDKQYKAA